MSPGSVVRVQNRSAAKGFERLGGDERIGVS